MNLKFIALMATFTAITGCAFQPVVPKDVPVSAADSAKAKEQIAQMVGFTVATYYEAQHVAKLPGWKCRVTPYEPFILMSDGTPGTRASDAMRAAYAKTGLDQHARVMWVDPSVSPNLKVGDEVKSIDGRSINTGDFYSMQVATRGARQYDNAKEPLKVVLEDGKTLEITRPNNGCDADITSYYFYHPQWTMFNMTPAFWLPNNVLKVAKSTDYQWLAAFSFYITSSPEADSRRSKFHVASVPILATKLIGDFIPFANLLTSGIIPSMEVHMGLNGIYANAAEFAERDSFARGSDPAAVPEFFTRANEQKISFGPGIPEFTDKELKAMRTLAAQLKAGNAPEPSYDKPADSGAAQKTAAGGGV